MVRLTRIYTKTGDKGTTALGDGRRVPKDHLRIEATGAVDELNAVVGLALRAVEDTGMGSLLKAIQNDLFDLGADLCLPEKPPRGRTRTASPLRMTQGHITPLEQAIDRLNGTLAPLDSFVLPGGGAASAWLHLARTVCRRAERRVVALARREPINPRLVVYLNRLSDLLFVMARASNAGGRADVLWKPGGAAT